MIKGEDKEFKALLGCVLLQMSERAANAEALKTVAVDLAKAWRAGMKQYKKMNGIS